MIQIASLTGSNSNTNYTDPATAYQIVGQVPIPGLARQLRISPNGITFFNGTNTVAIGMNDAWNLAVNYGDIGLSYSPYFTYQPVSIAVVHPASALFQVAVQNEITGLTYQWKYNNGSGWTNATGGVYTGGTSNTLNVTNSNTLNGWNFMCQATNPLGTSNSNVAMLTVT